MLQLQDYSVSRGEICLISAISDILNYYKLEYDESCLMGLCEGNLFYFGGLAVEAGEIVNSHILKLVRLGGMKYDINHILKVLGKYIGLKISGFSAGREEEVKRLIKYYIDKGTPILTLVMANYLEYSITYKKDRLSHAINIIGYDYEKEELEIADTYVNTNPVTKYQGKLSWKNFLNSLDLSDAIFEMKTKERLFAIELGEAKSFQEISPSVINESIISMAKNNLQKNDFFEPGIYCGIEGMKRFLCEIKVWMDEFNGQQLNKIMKCLHNLITNFGGPYIINNMMATYLQKIYQKSSVDIYKHLQTSFRDLQHQWYIFANICYKTVLTGKINKKIILSRLEHIIECEEILFVYILKIL